MRAAHFDDDFDDEWDEPEDGAADPLDPFLADGTVAEVLGELKSGKEGTVYSCRGGRELDLTQRQFELLAYLMEHPHVPVSREMIARDVWRETTATWTNLIAVQIAQLRRKIERPGSPPILHTIRGQGYQVGKSREEVAPSGLG